MRALDVRYLTSGRHTIAKGTVQASGNAVVRASGDAVVHASDYAEVYATERLA